MLFHGTPDYFVLRVFGCSCFPYLRRYNKNKLEFLPKNCFFLGYSSNHQGYRCLVIASGRVYLSRHVILNESIFPFQSLSKDSIITQPMESTSPIPLYPLTKTPISQTTAISPLPTQPILDQPLHEVSSSPTDQSNSNENPITDSNPTSPTTVPIQSKLPSTKHHMTTTFYNMGPVNQILNMRAVTIANEHIEPTCFSQAIKEPTWRVPIYLEFNTPQKCGTWSPVPPKKKSDGSVEHYKARLVANGFHQQ